MSNSVIGTIHMFQGNSIPTGWLPCDGRSVKKSTLPNGFKQLATALGAKPNATSVKLPNLEDLFVVGAGKDATLKTQSSNADSHYHAITPGVKNESTSSAGNHSHHFPLSWANLTTSSDSGEARYVGSREDIRKVTTRDAGNHNHSLSINFGTSSSMYAGQSAQKDPDWNHPKYYALVYMIYVGT